MSLKKLSILNRNLKDATHTFGFNLQMRLGKPSEVVPGRLFALVRITDVNCVSSAFGTTTNTQKTLLLKSGISHVCTPVLTVVYCMVARLGVSWIARSDVKFVPRIFGCKNVNVILRNLRVEFRLIIGFRTTYAVATC